MRAKRKMTKVNDDRDEALEFRCVVERPTNAGSADPQSLAKTTGIVQTLRNELKTSWNSLKYSMLCKLLHATQNGLLSS
uniref:Uncharacterized protein n=1 Tax=Trichuris muris TaxID=70415 RepID=A0A5S6Q6Z1_TRIMR